MRETGIAVLLNDTKLTSVVPEVASEDLLETVEWLDHPCFEHSSKNYFVFRNACPSCFQQLKARVGVK